MTKSRGRSLPLSLPRRFVGDVVHFAQKVPLVVVERRMDLALLAAERENSVPRPSWAAIFLKAYALVATAHPELRRAYLPWPWPRFYEHPYSVASVAVERRYREEYGVFFAVLSRVEDKELLELDALLRQYKEQPLENFRTFRLILRTGWFPRPLRRLLWWISLNFHGPLRARFLGTFGLTTVSGLGSTIQQFLSPLSTALTYDMVQPDGSVKVRLAFDHRVLDAGFVARALQEMETVLLKEILPELPSRHYSGLAA